MASRLIGLLERLGFHRFGFDFASARSNSKHGKTVILDREEVRDEGLCANIEALATKNANFRRVLYTAEKLSACRHVVHPAEEIGMEVHKLDQFFRVEEGSGEAILDGVSSPISAGFAVLVPAGTKHNIVNTSAAPLKLYTLYAPPNHRDGVVHRTRADAEKDNEHFDGKTTE